MGNIHQLEVRSRRRPGKPGQIYDSSNLNDEINITNAHPQAMQQDKITVDTAADNTDYTYTVNGVEVTIDSGDGATTASIAEALAEEHNASPMVRGQVIAEADNDEVLLESVFPGMEYEVETDDANLTLTSEQLAAEADPIGFGLVVIRGGSSDVSPYPNRLGRLADEEGLEKQSITFDQSGAATVTLNIDGEYFEASGATAEAMATAINAEVPANTVTAADDATSVTIEVDTAGDTFKLVGYSGDIELDDQERGDAIADIALGVARYAYDEETKDGEPAYPANAGAAVMRRGRIWVTAPGSVSGSDAVYVQMTGDLKGRVYTERSAGRVYLGDVADWYADRSDDGLAVLECDFR